jgi:hypothetical protein
MIPAETTAAAGAVWKTAATAPKHNGTTRGNQNNCSINSRIALKENYVG